MKDWKNNLAVDLGGKICEEGEMQINKIYLDDCFNVFNSIKDNSVDIVFTSPPYNRKRNDKYKYYTDIIDDYFEFLKKVITESIRVSSNNVFINLQKNYYNKSDVFKIIGEFATNITEIFIWEKSNPLPASGFNITNAYELIICFGKKLKSNKTYTKNHLTTSVNRMPKKHKAVMHYNVAEFFIKNFTKEKNIVFDPFMGIGTTALACKNNNRNYIGCEKIKEYYKESIKRLEVER